MLSNLFTVGEYTFKNYVDLTLDEQKLILQARNLNSKWMINQEYISLEQHLSWIESLKGDPTKLYFLVYKGNEPFIAVYYHDVTALEAYWGYFLIDTSYKTEVLKIEKIIIDLAFNELDLNLLLCINDVNNHVVSIHNFFGFKAFKTEKINDNEYIFLKLTREDFLGLKSEG